MAKRTTFSTRDIGIDLGTAHTRVYAQGRGIVLSEPSVAATDIRTGTVRAVGHAARESLGRTSGPIVATRPLKGGVITDLDAAEPLLRHCIRKARPSRSRSPRVIISVPGHITEVERQAVLQITARAGARSVHLVERAMVAALGAGLPVYEPQGSMVVDVGAGSTEMAITSLGGAVISRSSKVAGDAMDAAVIQYVSREYSINIGEPTAEQIKLALGTGAGIQVRGRDKTTGMPKYVDLTTQEVLEALDPAMRTIIESVTSAFDDCPPELYGDLMERGIALTGGGSLLHGLDTRIAHETGMPVTLVEEPLNCVALGTGRCLEEYERLTALFGARQPLSAVA